MNNRNYLLEFIWMWAKAAVLYWLGGSILGAMSSGGFDRFAGVAVAAMVFGFTFFNKVVPFNLFGNSDAVILFWVIKVLLSAAIGLIAFPIVNIYYIIHILVGFFRKE